MPSGSAPRLGAGSDAPLVGGALAEEDARALAGLAALGARVAGGAALASPHAKPATAEKSTTPHDAPRMLLT